MTGVCGTPHVSFEHAATFRHTAGAFADVRLEHVVDRTRAMVRRA
jgi:hypothetical protein